MPNQSQITLDDVKNFILNITPNPNQLYIIQPFGIGDILINGGLSQAVQNKKNKSATVLIAHERFENLGITFENFAYIDYLTDETMDLVKKYFYVTGDYEGDNYIYGHFRRTQGGGYE